MSALVFHAQAGSGDRSPLPSHAPAGRNDSASDRNVELDMAAMNATAFSEAAQTEGLVVSLDEVKQRVELYGKLYPGREVESGKVKTLLFAEKYLEAKGIRPEGSGPDTVPESGGEAARFATPEEAELAKRTVGWHRVLGREDVQDRAEKLEELAQLRLSSEHAPSAMWSLPDLQVAGDQDECLAWVGQTCLIPVREYNAALAYYPMPSGMPRDSARAFIFKKYLSEKRQAVEARGRGLHRNADSAVHRIRRQKQDFRWMQSTSAFGMPVRDMQLLQAAYQRHYGRYFGPGEEVTLTVIGSSDSAYIDSLYRVHLSWYRNRALIRSSTPARLKEPVLPWSYFKEQQVSEDLAALTDSLKVGQCSPPHRSPLGYFLVRLVKAVPKPEISFDEAFFQLTYLATRDKFLEMDSVVEARAKKYYAANLGRFANPDTMALRAWLIPRLEPTVAGKPGHGRKAPVIADTARYQAMDLASLALPSELRIALQEQERKDSSRTFFGPFPDPYGRWYFQLLSRKRSSGVLPYRLARKEILDRMTAPLEDQGDGTASDEAQEDVAFNLALAQAIRKEQFRKRLDKDGAMVMGSPNQATDSPGPNVQSEVEQAKAIETASAEINTREAKNRAEEERMLKKARVDMNRLFR